VERTLCGQIKELKNTITVMDSDKQESVRTVVIDSDKKNSDRTPTSVILTFERLMWEIW
jgi:hypothetical protein